MEHLNRLDPWALEGHCREKERRPLYTGVFVQRGGVEEPSPTSERRLRMRTAWFRGTSVVEGTEGRGSGNS